MRLSRPVLLFAAVLLCMPPALANESGAKAESELVLARELIAEREQLDRMKLDQSVSREAVLAQERKLMEVRSRLAAVLAGELARQSTDADQWRQAWESMKGFLREKLREFLDEPPPGTTRT